MIYYIDGVQVSEKRAKDYFFEGHRATLKWLNSGIHKQSLKSASDTWKKRATPRAQVQIFNISGILEMGGLEITKS